jgi:hypothetical protein
MVDREALEQFLLLARRFLSVTMITQLLHTYFYLDTTLIRRTSGRDSKRHVYFRISASIGRKIASDYFLALNSDTSENRS